MAELHDLEPKSTLLRDTKAEAPGDIAKSMSRKPAPRAAAVPSGPVDSSIWHDRCASCGSAGKALEQQSLRGGRA